MGLAPVKTTVSGGIPIFQKIIEWAQGGFTLDVTGLITDSTLYAGTPMVYDESTRLAKPLKVAKVHANAGGSATDYQVEKNSQLKVGDYVATTVGGKAYAITAIDTSNAAYDTITVGTSIGAATAGDTLFQSSATGATAAALNVTAKGLLYEDTKVGAGNTVSIVLRGTIYNRRTNAAIHASVKTSLPLIIFSESY